MDKLGEVVVFILTMIGVFFTLIGLMASILLFTCGAPTYNYQLIEKGVGYYHPETGEFTWKSGNVFIKE